MPGKTRKRTRTGLSKNFDLRRELQKISGKALTFKKLIKKLKEIRSRNLGALPPEYGIETMFGVMLKNGWLKETGRPKEIRICV